MRCGNIWAQSRKMGFNLRLLQMKIIWIQFLPQHICFVGTVTGILFPEEMYNVTDILSLMYLRKGLMMYIRVPTHSLQHFSESMDYLHWFCLNWLTFVLVYCFSGKLDTNWLVSVELTVHQLGTLSRREMQSRNLILVLLLSCLASSLQLT